jgi:hypothetical protein
LVVSVCHDSIFGRRSVCQSFLRSRAAPTRPKSEKPRKSREGKRIKRLKRQQQERKEKYRKRQCRANHEQHHQLSELSATHDVQHQRSGKNFQGGASRCPNPTPRGNDAIQIVFRIRSRWVSGYLGRNNSAIAPILLRFPLHRRCRQPPLKVIGRLAIVSTGRNGPFQVPVPP